MRKRTKNRPQQPEHLFSRENLLLSLPQFYQNHGKADTRRITGSGKCTEIGVPSVEETEKPERDLIPEADFNVIIHDKAVRHVGNLPEGLSLAADLERPFAVNNEIADTRKRDP